MHFSQIVLESLKITGACVSISVFILGLVGLDLNPQTTKKKIMRNSGNDSKGKAIVLLAFIIALLSSTPANSLYAQSKASIAVSNIDTRGIDIDPVAMGNLLRIELEKKKLFDVIDKYDMRDLLSLQGLTLEDCYGRTCIVEIGRALEVDQALTGSVERFNDKLVVSLRLFDVANGAVLNTDVAEYQYAPDEIDLMIQVSVNNILGLENDNNMVSLLANYEEPISTKLTNVTLNGPRMGVAYVTGDFAKALVASKSEGGYGGYPVLSQLGYQYEIQYLTAGNFNALVEFLPIVSGLEQGLFIPSIVFMNGFRFGKGKWEIAFGPSVGVRKFADGYYDGNNDWQLEREWYQQDEIPEGPIPYPIISRMDSRGTAKLGSRWIWAFGRTFQSGYLNIPVNIYISPQKQGWYLGASVGFNVGKKRSSRINDYNHTH